MEDMKDVRLFRCILPGWAADANPNLRRVQEGQFSDDTVQKLNQQSYNIYYLPNYPSIYESGTTADGSHIDTFKFVFVDMDLKDGAYPDKDAFLAALVEFGLPPSRIVDSGNGMHAYWLVSDLDAMSYLKLCRRLVRRLNTDPAVGQIYQLMRWPGTVNTKEKDAFKPCELILEEDTSYTCEQLDSALPPLSHEDEEHCKQHFEKTYRVNSENLKIDDKLPLCFAKLLKDNREVKAIWSGNTGDRSKADYRLGHIMFACGFSKEDAMSVLVNSPKAIGRAPVHRLSYAMGIIDKIWTFEITQDKEALTLSRSVKDILQKSGKDIKGTRFPCWSWLDNTEHGFRLGQIVGLVAGSGVGKTAIALEMFRGFVRSNPDYQHFFIPLEQPANEIAHRWSLVCGSDTQLHEKVHIISNYDDDGNFRHLSFDEIKEYLQKFKRITDKKIGCVVIDHIGALKHSSRDGRQSIEDICHQMKAFAVQLNVLLVMQSQAPREKAGIGDLELNKDAAYGTVYFESYTDYLVTLWQPLKRCYAEGAPTVTAFKFCKIRHKNQLKDVRKEDECCRVYFDPETHRLEELTEDQEKSFDYYLKNATNKRKQDRKTDLISYQSVKWTEETQAPKSP